MMYDIETSYTTPRPIHPPKMTPVIDPCPVDQLHEYIHTHDVWLDGCAIHVICIIPYTDPNRQEVLYTLRYVFAEEVDRMTWCVLQVTLTQDGYGYSRGGPRYRIRCVPRNPA